MNISYTFIIVARKLNQAMFLSANQIRSTKFLSFPSGQADSRGPWVMQFYPIDCTCVSKCITILKEFSNDTTYQLQSELKSWLQTYSYQHGTKLRTLYDHFLISIVSDCWKKIFWKLHKISVFFVKKFLLQLFIQMFN